MSAHINSIERYEPSHERSITEISFPDVSRSEILALTVFSPSRSEEPYTTRRTSSVATGFTRSPAEKQPIKITTFTKKITRTREKSKLKITTPTENLFSDNLDKFIFADYRNA